MRYDTLQTSLVLLTLSAFPALFQDFFLVKGSLWLMPKDQALTLNTIFTTTAF